MSLNPEEPTEEYTSTTHLSKFSTKKKIPEIPEETIKEIMFLLPVKSLLKFRCLSPSWLSFIDSPYFLKTHFSKSTPKIILNSPGSCYALDITPVEPKPRAQLSVLKLCYPHSDTFIFGSCKGVLLTHHYNGRPGVLLAFEHRWDVVLQNPFTKTFHKIPFVQHQWPGPKHVMCAAEKFIYGLGYDALTDDYKLFRNCQFFGCHDGNSFYSQVNIYSLKTKSYRQIEPFPYYVKYDMAESAFAGGALHWVVSSSPWDKSEWIAAFDVSTEEYRLVDQPVYSSGKFRMHVTVLGGCLSVVCNYLRVKHTEVWVMKEYGNLESWYKLLSFSAAEIGVEPFDYLKPLFYSECGKKVLIEIGCRTLLWYDVEKKSAELVELDGHRIPKKIQAIVHLESLVKLNNRGGGREDEMRRAHDKIPKKRDDFLSKGFKLKL